jgi:hypothetical protein
MRLHQSSDTMSGEGLGYVHLQWPFTAADSGKFASGPQALIPNCAVQRGWPFPKGLLDLGSMAHTCNPSTWEVEAGEVPDQPGLHSETLSQNTKGGDCELPKATQQGDRRSVSGGHLCTCVLCTALPHPRARAQPRPVSCVAGTSDRAAASSVMG